MYSLGFVDFDSTFMCFSAHLNMTVSAAHSKSEMFEVGIHWSPLGFLVELVNSLYRRLLKEIGESGQPYLEKHYVTKKL